MSTKHIEIDGKIPSLSENETNWQWLLKTQCETVLQMQGVECFFDIFWKTIDPHRISQSFLGVWEGSLENVLTTTITVWKTAGKTFEI